MPVAACTDVAVSADASGLEELKKCDESGQALLYRCPRLFNRNPQAWFTPWLAWLSPAVSVFLLALTGS